MTLLYELSISYSVFLYFKIKRFFLGGGGGRASGKQLYYNVFIYDKAMGSLSVCLINDMETCIMLISNVIPHHYLIFPTHFKLNIF
jgi:hypothetical protein